MSLRSTITWGLIAVGLVAAGQVSARTRTKHTTSKGSMSAAAFVRDAGEGGLTEVEMGRMGVERATDAEVKTFAQRMVDDHSKANDELKQLATQKHWTVPSAMNARHKASMKKMEKLSGNSFDRAYMKDMVKDHDADVAAFQKYSTKGSDPDLKAWAAKTLPTLQDHQQSAHTIADKLGAVASTRH